MKVKATRNFSGLVSMAKGDIRNLEEGLVLKDLLSCGYVEAVETVNAEVPDTSVQSAEAAAIEDGTAAVQNEVEAPSDAETSEETTRKPVKKSGRKG